MARTAVIAGTASAVAGGVHHHQQQKWAAKDAQAQQAADQQAFYEQQMMQQQQMQAQQAQAQAPGQGDYMAELEKLGQLKTQGIITEEEFQAKKKQLLGI
jgi:hypothetical protein